MWLNKQMNLSCLRILSSALILLLCLAAASCNRGRSEARDLFNERCAACHAPDGSGNTPVGQSMGLPDLRSAQVQSRSDDQLANVIRNGTTKMPPVKSLSAAQTSALVSYIRSLRR